MAEQQYPNNRSAQLNLSGFGRGGVRPVVPPSTFRQPAPTNFGLSSSGRVFGLSSSGRGYRGGLGRSGAGVAGDLTTTVPQNTPMNGILPRVSIGMSGRGGRGGFGLSGAGITKAPEPCSGPGIGQVVESNGSYAKPQTENDATLRSGANGQTYGQQQNGGHADPNNEKQFDSSAGCPNCIRHTKITQMITDVSRGLQDLSKAFQEMQEHNHQ